MSSRSWLFALLLGACNTDLAETPGSDPAAGELGEAEIPAEPGVSERVLAERERAVPVERLRAGQKTELVIDGQKIVESVRRTSSGELTVAHVPELAATIEVGAGEPCGVTDGAGRLRSCQPGSSCLSAGEGSTATCTAPVRAPAFDR